MGKPTAHITKKKSRLKVYNGHVVFLNDKDNFEFEIHNPTQKSILCKIKLNGEYISTSGIVIKPGQRVFLERFLDTNNKFEFSTYEVKDTSSNRTAIDLNGDVRIEFYNEQTYNQYPHLSGGNWNTGWSNINTGSPYYVNPTFTTSNSNGNMTFTSSNSIGVNTSYLSNTIETGRVEKGDKSKQQFINSYNNFEYNAFRQIIFKILPLGTKPIEGKDLKKYCTECGNAVKSNWKFCPGCSTKI